MVGGHSFPNKNHKLWTNENSPFVFPNLTKTLGWVVGFTNRFGKGLKKNVFFTPSLIVPMLLPANNQNFDVQKTHIFLRNMYSEFEIIKNF